MTNEINNKIIWWGYRHMNGSIQAKRYFGSLDIYEARESPFCKTVSSPFEAINREDALKQLEKLV